MHTLFVILSMVRAFVYIITLKDTKLIIAILFAILSIAYT